jgi:hypothetical protein
LSESIAFKKKKHHSYRGRHEKKKGIAYSSGHAIAISSWSDAIIVVMPRWVVKYTLFSGESFVESVRSNTTNDVKKKKKEREREERDTGWRYLDLLLYEVLRLLLWRAGGTDFNCRLFTDICRADALQKAAEAPEGVRLPASGKKKKDIILSEPKKRKRDN